MLYIDLLDKFKACALHFIFSLFLASCSLLIVYLVWYPQSLAKATGVNTIFLMMLIIDVLLGPILTFIVYNRNKRTLKFDLFIIILIQLSALIYGMYSISQGRPAWIVYTVDRFELVRNNQILKENIQNTKAEYKSPSWLKPQYVAVEVSQNIIEKKHNILQEVISGMSLSQHPERYVPLEHVKYQMQQHAQNMVVLNQFNKKRDLDSVLLRYPQATAWLPLQANAVDMVVLINKEKGEIVKIVDLRPWK